ncbi:hypothetical protein L2E82_51958 [Cichorium intybus]|nr:hypothetical protein L2E82_51958 [Cichorium intybus]
MGKKHYSIPLWDMKTMFQCGLVMSFLGGLAILSFYINNIYQEAINSNVKVTLATMTSTKENENTDANTNRKLFYDKRRLKITPLSLTDTCDLFSGRWVHDNKSRYPLYKEDECPYLHADLACLTYGRKDSKYQQWRWQPNGCDFPRNQWDSMMCMLHSSIPGKKKVGLGGLNGTLYTFRATDYNISIDYYWAPMLVESNGDDPSNHRLDHRTIRIKAIEKHARHWVDADILVFNTYLWWRLPIIKFLKGAGSLLGGPNQIYDEVGNVRAYEKVLETWSKWVHKHINPAKTKMFFMAPTATHSRAADWGGKKEGTCYKETEPREAREYGEEALLNSAMGHEDHVPVWLSHITPLSLTDTCDLFSGRWVHDNKSRYPLYKEDECPYLHADLACLTYGRKDSKYQQWRWQPNGCDFPRNQWDSMMCMLHSSIPGKKKVGLGGLNGTLYTFRATDYNISIDYYWAPMLVESNGDDPSNHRLDHRTIRIKAIEKHARHWVDADILVFNTYLWWRLPIIKFLKGAGSLLGGPNQIYDEVGNVRAYEKVLETWSKWVHKHINPAKTKMFFMAPTATHSRKDAHPTVHRRLWRPLTDAQKKNPERASDCTHWCLPGVPDIWNELLLAYIFPVTNHTNQ